VIDCRGNGGGSALAAEQSVGLFVPSAPRPLLVQRTFERSGQEGARYSEAAAVWDRPLEIWVDGRTASAAECFAGALHDIGPPSARLVGSRTFGKGVIQGYYPLSNGGALVLPFAKTATPSGQLISDGLPVQDGRIFSSTPLSSISSIGGDGATGWLAMSMMLTQQDAIAAGTAGTSCAADDEAALAADVLGTRILRP
jgi:hypothetical protein